MKSELCNRLIILMECMQNFAGCVVFRWVRSVTDAALKVSLSSKVYSLVAA